MIGGSALVVGLLLLVTALAARWLPADAVFAATSADEGRMPEPGWSGVLRRARNPIRAFILAPVHPATWNANLAIGAGFWVAVLSFMAFAAIFSVGIATLFVGVGVIVLPVAIEGSRAIAWVERRRASLGQRRLLLPHAYREFGNGPREAVLAEFADENRWRDVLYVVINFPLAVLELAVVVAAWGAALFFLTSPLWFDAASGSVASYWSWLFQHSDLSQVVRTLFGLSLLPVAASVSQVTMALHRAVVSGLLCASEKRELERRVETLTQSRSAALGVEASELRRIERDLHDGAQQRLVMLTIDLSLAKEKIDSDPESARKLVEDARDQARQALAELRDLVRGIAPAILLDRGLPAALASIAVRCAVPATVQTNVAPGERLPEAVERAAYFVVTEALANVMKHSGASRAEIRCRRDEHVLVVEVWDDGKGGAKLSPGSGLEGLAGRAAALDGQFMMSSPAGGPTVLHAEFPAPPRSLDPTAQAAVRATGPLAGSPPSPGAAAVLQPVQEPR